MDALEEVVAVDTPHEVSLLHLREFGSSAYSFLATRLPLCPSEQELRIALCASVLPFVGLEIVGLT